MLSLNEWSIILDFAVSSKFCLLCDSLRHYHPAVAVHTKNLWYHTNIMQINYTSQGYAVVAFFTYNNVLIMQINILVMYWCCCKYWNPMYLPLHWYISQCFVAFDFFSNKFFALLVILSKNVYLYRNKVS